MVEAAFRAWRVCPGPCWRSPLRVTTDRFRVVLQAPRCAAESPLSAVYDVDTSA